MKTFPCARSIGRAVGMFASRYLSRATMGLWASVIVVSDPDHGKLVDVSPSATVAIDNGEAQKAARAASADGPLRDGSVATTASGRVDIKEQLQTSIVYKGLTTAWEWDQAQPVAAIDLLVPETQEIPAVKVVAKAPDGEYHARLFYTESAEFKPVADWRDASGGKAAAKRYRIVLSQPFVTRGLRIMVGAPGPDGVELGEVRVLAVPSMPAAASKAPAIDPARLTTWFANPWANTEGGGDAPAKAATQAPWAMSIAQNDTEQALIGFLNTGQKPASVTVSLENIPPGLSGTLMAVAAIERRKKNPRQPSTALMNLFTPEQVKHFYGYFPEQFVSPETWADFPVLTLPPGKPVYVWIRLRAVPGKTLQPGRARMTLVAATDKGAVRQPIELDVLKVRMPQLPVVQSWTYGIINDENAKEHYVTVNGGFRYYLAENLSRAMGNTKIDWVERASEDPEAVRKTVRAAMDSTYAEAKAEGYGRDEVLFTIYDEPHDDIMPNWLLIARELKANDPNAKIIANPIYTYRQRVMTLDGTIRKIAPFVDVWQPHSKVIEKMPEVVDAIKKTGKPFWFYKNVGVAESRDEAAISGYYRSAPWNVLKHDMQGAGFWAEARWFGDMWNDFDSDLYRDWSDAAIVFQDETGSVITTRNMESWREGLEDVAIGKMLRSALDQGLLGGNDARAAEEWLMTAPDKVLRENRKSGGAAAQRSVGEALGILNRNWKDGWKVDKDVELHG